MWHIATSKSSSWNLVERLVFPAPPNTYTASSFPHELIFVPRRGGAQVPCLFLPCRHARFLFMFFHGNAEDLGLSHTFCGVLREQFQVHVLAVEYPGYGICPGPTDEEGILANALAAFEFVTSVLNWPLDGIKLFGRSLGSGPAIALATRYRVAGLILVAPFTSVKEVFRTRLGALADVMEDRFPNRARAKDVRSPTLMIHGRKDALVPCTHSEEIYQILTSKKMLVNPTEMGHNTSLFADIGYFVLPMLQFFSLPDYTFEDITIPEWVFPAKVFSPPFPGESLKASVSEPNPTIGQDISSNSTQDGDAEAADVEAAMQSESTGKSSSTDIDPSDTEAPNDETGVTTVPVPGMPVAASRCYNFCAPNAGPEPPNAQVLESLDTSIGFFVEQWAADLEAAELALALDAESSGKQDENRHGNMKEGSDANIRLSPFAVRSSDVPDEEDS